MFLGFGTGRLVAANAKSAFIQPAARAGLSFPPQITRCGLVACHQAKVAQGGLACHKAVQLAGITADVQSQGLDTAAASVQRALLSSCSAPRQDNIHSLEQYSHLACLKSKAWAGGEWQAARESGGSNTANPDHCTC